MRPISEIKNNYRLRIVSSGEDGFAAYINHPCYKPTAIAVIASWGGGWEHVSVSLVLEAVVAGEVDELFRDGPFSEGVLEPLEEFPVEVGEQGADA